MALRRRARTPSKQHVEAAAYDEIKDEQSAHREHNSVQAPVLHLSAKPHEALKPHRVI